MTNFRLLQTENLHKKFLLMKMVESFLKGKSRKCWLRTISPLPTGFSKDLYSRQIKTGLVRERVKVIGILDQSKLKHLQTINLKVIEMAKFVLDKVENIVGKEEMLVPALSSFASMFSKGSFFRVVKCWDCVVKS